jgi:hypothetical protein
MLQALTFLGTADGAGPTGVAQVTVLADKGRMEFTHGGSRTFALDTLACDKEATVASSPQKRDRPRRVDNDPRVRIQTKSPKATTTFSDARIARSLKRALRRCYVTPDALGPKSQRDPFLEASVYVPEAARVTQIGKQLHGIASFRAQERLAQSHASLNDPKDAGLV